ncbi:MAG: hypothetical protein ACI9MR_001415 [Myxococcota bacterium]|jgi:hypothetical protein
MLRIPSAAAPILLAFTFGACLSDDPTVSGGDGLQITVAPLTLPSIGGVCYDFRVTNGPDGTGDTVWSKGTPGLNGGTGDTDAVCSGQFGDGRPDRRPNGRPDRKTGDPTQGRPEGRPDRRSLKITTARETRPKNGKKRKGDPTEGRPDRRSLKITTARETRPKNGKKRETRPKVIENHHRTGKGDPTEGH